MARPAIHPGEHLAEELKELRMSASELARCLGVPPNRVTSILHGTRAVTGDTALRLGHFFGTAPHFWLNLQALYDLRVAEEKAGRRIEALPTLKEAHPRWVGKGRLQAIDCMRGQNRGKVCLTGPALPKARNSGRP